jgi:serine/threonine protein kinase
MRTSISTASAGVGTLRWMAAELMKEFTRTYTPACDVFSLAVVLWEMATRQIPYEGVDDDSIRSGVKAGDRMDIPAKIPSAFAELISKCWSANPNDRLATGDIYG